MARYCSLFSGSGGNCTYIGCGEGGILIDAGVSASRTVKALGERDIDIGSIRAVFVTHEHTDHIGGLAVLTEKLGCPVYASAGTLDGILEAHALRPSVRAEVMGRAQEVAGMRVTAFHTSHDSRESLGYTVQTPDGHTLGIVSDSGVVTDAMRRALAGCDLIHIESNHDPELLRSGPYPYPLKQRILSSTGHLSNATCSAELVSLARQGACRFILTHLSRENNRPELARQTALAALGAAGLIDGLDFLLKVAPPVNTEGVLIF